MTAAPRRTPQRTPHGIGLLAAALAVLVVAVLADLMLGQGLRFADLAVAVTDPASAEREILLHVRAPRVAAAALAGAASGAAGFLLQSVLRNPLASPDLVGVTPVAVVAVVVSLALGVAAADRPLTILAAAAVGGILGGSVTVGVATLGRADAVIVAGVLTGALGNGVTVLVLALHPERMGGVLRWIVGSVDGHVWSGLAAVTPVIGIAMLAAIVLGTVLPLLACGDDHAWSVGVGPARARAGVMAVVVVLAAAAAATAGAVAFIGLLAGHIARRLAGLDRRVSVPLAALTGSILLVACDAVAQAVTLLAGGLGSRAGVPAGAVAAAVGAVLLIRLVRSGKAIS